MESNRKHFFLKGLLIIQTIGLLAYTVIAIKNDGVNFLARAQDYMFSMKWIGQFTLDFNCYLMLSALWIAWRNKFTGKSILLAIIAAVLGIIVFAPYLVFVIQKENGSISKVLIGDRKVNISTNTSYK